MNLSTFLSSAICLLSISLSTYNITLQDQSVSTKISRYRLTKVIDARVNKEDIGVVQLGVTDKQSQLVFKRSFKEEIYSAIASAFSGNSEKELIIKINQLIVNEWSIAYRETGIASINLSYLSPNPDGSFIEICNTVVSTNINGGDVTPRHARNIIDALDKSLICFKDRITKNLLTSIPIKKDDLIAPTDLTIQDFKLSSELKLFAHYSDFIDRLPTDASSFKIQNSLDGFKLKDHKNKQTTDFWGAEYNGELHLYLNKKFRPLAKDETGFFKVLQDIDQNAVGNADLWFSLPVSIFVSGITEKDRKIRLDPNLGQLDIYSLSKSQVRNKKDVTSLSLKEYSIVQINPFIKSKQQFILKIDGTVKIQNITRSQFFRIQPEWFDKSIEVCVQDGSKCLTLELPENATLVRVGYKKGILTSEQRSIKERQTFLETTDRDYEVE